MLKKTRLQHFIQNCFLSLLSVFRVALLSKFFISIRKIPKKTSDCVILANGPSLKEMIGKYSDFLEDKDLICVNYFPETMFFDQLKPGILITAAPELWLEDITEDKINNSNRLFRDIDRKTNWPMVLCIPRFSKKYKRWQHILKDNAFINKFFYNGVPVDGLRAINHFLFRNNLGMPNQSNVLIPALMIAINTKYEHIYLWGADHSWLNELRVDEENRVFFHQKHFYDQTTSKPKHHFNAYGEAVPLHLLLRKFMNAFKGYHMIRSYAENRGIRIINQTPGSYIDAFERSKT